MLVGPRQGNGEMVAHSIDVPACLAKKLRQHQREGVQFMFECGKRGIGELGGQ
jgi:hypothetical protein